ncbi:MAG: DUF3857 and transglutaminase domain-containing protein [Bacteroidales bacterium]|nr:DUF3857 and transglutaminase domain-containing protein [Bacteroidales bacterium]
MILFFVIISGFTKPSTGQSYAFDLIPKELLNNSKAVIRSQDTELEIQSEQKATLTVSYAMTIINESGIDNAALLLFYDKFSRISNIHCTVYDADGKKVEKIDRDEILDRSAISGYSIYEDHRLNYIEPAYRTVPFTVQYGYKIVYNGILDFPDFILFSDYEIALEEANFKIITSDKENVRFHEQHIDNTCNVINNGSQTIYSWNFTNVKPLKAEPFSPPVLEFIPSVLIAPNDFKIRNQWGNAETWESFGSWIYSLTKGKDELSEETRNEVLQMIASVNDVYGKIRIIYQYFQKKTRYASIQIGLGGWEPFDAETVDRLSYGDCKALTNYLQALLKVAGIPSYYTLVKAGDYASEIITGFPSNQFNHAILCVPLGNDTLWLECTNQNIPMGYLGTFTNDRHVLIVDEKGGIIRHTCVYDENDNIRNRKANIDLDHEGNGMIKVVTNYNGMYFDDMEGILRSDDTDKKKRIEKNINLGNFKLENFEMTESKDIIPNIAESVELNAKNIGVYVGDLMLIVPNLLSRQDPFSGQMTKRRNPIYIRRSIQELDSVFFNVPKSLAPDASLLSQEINSEFGKYVASTCMIGGKLCYTRQFILYKGEFPPDKYNDFIDFFDKISIADRKKIALQVVK